MNEEACNARREFQLQMVTTRNPHETDFERALRCLADGGTVVIEDNPGIDNYGVLHSRAVARCCRIGMSIALIEESGMERFAFFPTADELAALLCAGAVDQRPSD